MTGIRLAIGALVLAAAFNAQAAGFELNGVALGDGEAVVLKVFPSAHCKPLQWKSDAAERRCDDGKIVVAGVAARVTVYLKRDAVQAIDVRFDVRDLNRLAAHFKSLYGKPNSEGREKVYREGKEAREVYKIAWRRGEDRAVLSSVSNIKRASMMAARGNFDEEIYRVK
ncbi:MAG: hypothetical protein HY017_24475 [Betaproteobacteria bacterium]|nr:hypothetical protein [Betaproteobacteria bacterium]